MICTYPGKYNQNYHKFKFKILSSKKYSYISSMFSIKILIDDYMICTFPDTNHVYAFSSLLSADIQSLIIFI